MSLLWRWVRWVRRGCAEGGAALFSLMEHGLKGLHRRFYNDQKIFCCAPREHHRCFSKQPGNLLLRPARAAVPFLSKKGTKDDSGSTLNTPLFIPSGDAGLVECHWILLCLAGFEIFSFVVTALGGNYYALLRIVPPQPPRGFLLRIAC